MTRIPKQFLPTEQKLITLINDYLKILVEKKETYSWIASIFDRYLSDLEPKTFDPYLVVFRSACFGLNDYYHFSEKFCQLICFPLHFQKYGSALAEKQSQDIQKEISAILQQSKFNDGNKRFTPALISNVG